MSTEIQLKQWLAQRGMSVEAFSSTAQKEGISGCSATRIREAFAGKSFDGPLSLRIWNLRNEIEALCRATEPLVLDLFNGAIVYDLLCRRRQFNLAVEDDAEFIRKLLSGVGQ